MTQPPATPEARHAAPLPAGSESVMRLAEVDGEAVARLFAGHGATLVIHGPDATLPGSYWGDTEAGLIGHELHVRPDTPLHSLLHEGCHYLCMDDDRRAGLDTDAGGEEIEECAVCYLQILLADVIEGFGRDRMLADMDAWGYSFRLGSARAWFEQDAADARAWLAERGLLALAGEPPA